MKCDVKKIIEKELKSYTQKTIKISGKEYTLYIFSEDEDLNLFEGFLYSELKDKNELSYFMTRYRAPVSGYVPRISLLFYGNQLIIKDYRRNKYIRKTLGKINKSFISKIEKALSEPIEDNFNKLFDRTDIIEEFYILYKKARDYLLKNIKGISEEERKEEFVDNLMMQILTLWYLQERGFFDNDTSYLITKFKELKQKKLFNGFKNYYEFLTYFFDKICNHSDSQYYRDSVVGKVVVVGPAISLNGDYDSKAISIPDECFYKEGMTNNLINTPPKKISDDVPLLNLFESRDWTEGNIDEFVLGAIYEKLITYMERKKLGAYYTPEEITSYICKNTINPYLVDRINERFSEKFESIDQIIEHGNKEILLYLFERLKEIKICDPAVGSAHFLESAINVLVDIYEKLRNKAKELGLRNGLEILVADEKGGIKSVNLLEIDDEEQFKLFVKFFIILSKNIYGVDINPSALKVAKARLFLTLAKHFDINKNYFIRFPNVHFNLREGNSLIGYVKLEREKEEKKGQLALDLFVEESEATYIVEGIKIVTELKEYLRETVEVLGITGDILRDVEDLNKILSKKEIKWSEFETVMRTKEKLIRVLIASLNSKYAKPLNELLNQITKLFNNKLDEKFAKEYNIDLSELKKIKTFHWIFEFPEVFLERGGFDVIVGNPPYGRFKQIIEEKKEKDMVSKIYSNLYTYQIGNLNLYKLFLEKSYEILKDKSYFGMIFPSSFLGEIESKELRKLFFENCTVRKILEFPERTKVFEGNTQAVCILIYKKMKKEDYPFAIKTNISREEKNRLESLKFLEIKKNELIEIAGNEYRIPTFVNPDIEWKILKHISKYLPFRGNKQNPSIGEVGVGHLDETLDKEFMGDELGDKLLVKGIHLDRYFVNLDPNGPKPRWVINEREFFYRKPEAKKIAEMDKIIGRNTINKASKPRLRFAFLPKGYVITNNVKFITLSSNEINAHYIIAVLNSSVLNWRFELFSMQNAVRNYDIEHLPIPRISKEEQKTFVILSKYMHFLKQYQYYFAKDDKDIRYIIDYFDNLLDCLVYELYLGEVVKIPIRQLINNKLMDVPYNFYEISEKERSLIFEIIKKVFKDLEDYKKLNESLFLLKRHDWIKAIYDSLR
ncbi:MAG: N-6 DNA methylase [Candidatus Thermoplasmatota archaeon]